MTKVLIATVKPFAKVAVENISKILKDAEYELNILEKYSSKDELLKAVADVDALIIRSDKIDDTVMAAAPNLKIVVRAGAGYDNVDLEAASKRNIVVMNTPGQNSNAVAELIFGMLVYQVRNHFNGTPGTELKGKKLGIHAFGHVGKQVARIGKGFGMEIFAFDPFISNDIIEKSGVKAVDSIKEMYGTCDFVSLHIPATSQTIKSINYDLLSGMKEGATLINTARKEIIDEEGLLKLMNENESFYYISDIAPDNKSLFEDKFPERCFFTPKKMGAQTAEANINAGIAAANQIIDFIEKGVDTFKVN